MIQAGKYRNNALVLAEMVDAGIVLMKENLRRRNPDADQDRLNAILASWLRREDDPLPGDTAGSVRVRERHL